MAEESMGGRFKRLIGVGRKEETAQKEETETPSEPAPPAVETPKKTTGEETTGRTATLSPKGPGTTTLREGFLGVQEKAQEARPLGSAVPAKGSPAEAQETREREERGELTNP